MTAEINHSVCDKGVHFCFISLLFRQSYLQLAESSEKALYCEWSWFRYLLTCQWPDNYCWVWGRITRSCL